jgi:hypothetical protein
LFAVTGKKERNKLKDAFGNPIGEYDYLQSRKTGKLYIAINVGDEIEAFDTCNEYAPMMSTSDGTKLVVRHSTDFMFLASKPNWKG